MASKLKNTVLLAAIVVAGSIGSAHAVSVNNADDTAQTLIVTEDGVKNEIVVGVGETVVICPNGCFVTMPNGDRAALSGAESLQIKDGAGIVSQ